MIEDSCETSEVLIVDDNCFNIQAMVMMLEQFKLSASKANNGTEALALV